MYNGVSHQIRFGGTLFGYYGKWWNKVDRVDGIKWDVQ